jgi:uncharacterized protein DUF4112
MSRPLSSPTLVPEVGTLDRRLERLRRVGHLLDNSFRVPGTNIRFGIDAIIGLVPGLGDILGGVLSLYIIAESARFGAPRALLARMGWNVALDTLVGEIPLFGDLFDLAWKSNLRNLALLEAHLEQPGAVRKANRSFLVLLSLALVLLTVGAVTLAVILLRFLDGLLKGGVLG